MLTAACIDLEKAYDYVNTDLLEKKLTNFEFNKDLIIWISSFLRERILVLGNVRKSIHRGLAQGSGLSPLLFNLYTASLHDIEDDGSFVFQFADDFFILTFGDNFDEAKMHLINKIREFSSQCKSMDLRINL